MRIPSWKSEFEKTAGNAESDALEKARNGLRSVAEAQRNLGFLAGDDQTKDLVEKASVALGKIKKILEKRAEDTAKIIRNEAKKAMPPELKREAAKAAKLIAEKLVDEKSLKVIPWSQKQFRPDEKKFEVVFRIEKAQNGREYQKTLMQYVGGSMPQGVHDGSDFSGKPTKAQDFANAFLAGLRGWSGLKGEDAANADRAKVTGSIKSALSYCARNLGMDHEDVEVNGITLSVGYRSRSLPKEGAYDVGEHRYDEMVNDELAKAKKMVERELSSYKDKIEKISYGTEEKGWVYITVKLK